MYAKVKKTVFQIIDSSMSAENKKASIYKLSILFNIFIILLILLNVALVIADTFTLSSKTRLIFYNIEVFSLIVFTIEYILRLWTANYIFLDKKPWAARLKYMSTPMAIIDLLVILPFYIPFAIPIDFRVLRILRIIRVLRIFKLSRYNSAVNVILKVFKSKFYQIITSMFIVFLLMVISSVMIYYAEHDAQPEAFKNAFSALWWAVATLTTVGYGDIYPITIMGKILSSSVAILGIGLVAVPTGILSAGFMEFIDKQDDNVTSKADEIRNYHDLLNDNIITIEEFQNKKEQLLKD